MRSSDVLSRHRAAGRELEAAGIRSFVREQGDGEPVLCMHGVPASSFVYRKVIAELAGRGMRSVAFDLPGLGLAARPEQFDYSWTGLGKFSAAASFPRFAGRSAPTARSSCDKRSIRRHRLEQLDERDAQWGTEGPRTLMAQCLIEAVQSGRQAAGEPPAVLDRRKPRLSRAAPNLKGGRQPRGVVERSRLDDRELRLLGQQRDDRRTALRAELALTFLAGIGPHGHIRGERVAPDMERCARDDDED
jgi:hypothetical protein